MYSQCPDCQTRFRVTAEILRVAHGTVRCGRCGSAFDALARLSDMIPPAGSTFSGVGSALIGATSAASPPSERGAAAEFHFSADDLERVFVDARDWQRQYGPTGAAADSGIPTNETSELEVDEGEALEDITLEGERIQIDLPPHLEDDEELVVAHEQAVGHDLEATDRFKALDESMFDRKFIEDEGHNGEQEEDEILKLADSIREEEALAAAASPVPADPPRPVKSIAPQRWQPPVREADDDELPIGRRITGDDEEEEVSHRGTVAWTLGSLVLALALLAQLTHYFRQDLVRHPRVGPVLSQVYDRLGLSLAPNWDPHAFEIRQWGDASATPTATRMSVQASIRNKAAFAQPYPLLRLELEDRFGAPVATRDFEPAEYLKVPSLATRMLAAGASDEADLEIVDPGADAVGYRLDVCLRESPEILRCAQGPG